ncbi:MAG: glycosyl transferase [Oscillospiraceae bacterium]|nr:glycosyl transferase [Oscillospiraceae bacterium]
MKRIAFFCIPAHGHTNPMLPVAAELVRRGDRVRFYSFREFEAKILASGAEFVPCDEYLPPLSEKEEAGLKSVSSTEMAVQDLRITLAMDAFLDGEFRSFQPDVVYTDSVCFWGKLNAWKHKVPMVVSTSTFAFNQISSRYMKNSPREMADMVLGLPRIARELKALEPYGYHVNGVFSLIQNDNATDTVVYTSRRFQPCAESFSDHYCFVGPSVFSQARPQKEKERPLVYISLGTVINDRPDFYSKCIKALEDLNADVVISCGNAVDRESFGALPENIRIFPYVDQLEVLSRTDVFLTHCGMNSVSESLYMAAPMILYPQTGEQCAVARRVTEIGAGVLLTDDSAQGIRRAVEEVLGKESYARSAGSCSEDFRSCSGSAGAADYIESAPHASDGVDVVGELNAWSKRFRTVYSILAAVIILLGILAGWRLIWIFGVAAGVLSTPICNRLQPRAYASILKKHNIKPQT